MKLSKLMCTASVVLMGTVAVLAQDPVKLEPTHYKVVLENASVRVLQVSYAPGTKSQMHQHPDSIAIALTPSKVRFTAPDGKATDSDMANESAMYIAASSHSPANVGTGPVNVLLVEFKAATPGKATLPAAREGLAMKVLAEGARGMAYRTTAAPDFAEATGTKHDYDQIVIPLGAAQMSLSVAGQPPKTTWARGEAVFIGRGTAHEAKNVGGKPVDFIIVAIK